MEEKGSDQEREECGGVVDPNNPQPRTERHAHTHTQRRANQSKGKQAMQAKQGCRSKMALGRCNRVHSFSFQARKASARESRNFFFCQGSVFSVVVELPLMLWSDWTGCAADFADVQLFYINSRRCFLKYCGRVEGFSCAQWIFQCLLTRLLCFFSPTPHRSGA